MDDRPPDGPANQPVSKPRRRTWRQWFSSAVLPRGFRLALLAAVVYLLHIAAGPPSVERTVSLEHAKFFFPTATAFGTGDVRAGGQAVLDENGKLLGLLLTTSPHADDLIGYSGPSNLLIALDPQNQILGVQLLASGDTPSHVEQVRASPSFWQQFVGLDRSTRKEKVDAVSGSTLTSLAIAEAIDRRLHGSSVSLRFPEVVKLREIRKLFKAARKFEADTPRAGWYKAFDGEGNHIGYVVRTSPYSDNARGYQGPTESLVAVDVDGKTVLDVLVRKSYDTPEYVDRVAPNEEFRASLSGRTIEEWAQIDFKKEGIEGVSGATQTSFAIADGVRRRFAADTAVEKPKTVAINWQPGLLAVIGGGCAVAFSPLKNHRRVRQLWHVVLVVVFAVWLGDLLSLALFVGWARNGIPWRTAPAVVLLVAVALLVPWGAKKQIYCQHLCPHGAAQSLLGQFKRWHVRIPARVQRWLGILPGLLLGISVALAVFATSFDLAKLEPFDAWVLKGAAVVSATIAVVGLVASVFVPFAYCRYGCPTGELLRLVKSSGNQDRLQRRDGLAGGIVLLVAAGLFAPGLWASINSTDEPLAEVPEPRFLEIGGKAFGTTWSAKIRGDHALAPLQAAVSEEMERIESSLSHWRETSATAQFNSSETTFETEQPEEFLQLVAKALDLSLRTDGRYDITVAPLVDAWGYGPSGQRPAPTDEEVAQLRQRIGWDKVKVNLTEKTIRKTHPRLQIDLGSLLQGYAADCAAKKLTAAGVQEFLIDVGGELLAQGSWKVGIEDPRDTTKTLRTFVLKDAALATSGLYRASKDEAGERKHHLISPKLGKPVPTTTILCAVIAPTATEADMWGTALLAVGLPDGLALADRQQLAVLYFDERQGIRTNGAGEKALAPRK
jgi:NosR/NirI family nitrous oxide reductase transcriptional regulator